MSTLGSFLKSAVLALGIGSLALVTYARDRDQRADHDKVERDLSEARKELAEARASLSARAPAPPTFVAAPASDTDAVAARVVAAMDAHVKQETVLANEAVAPTGGQLAARADAAQTLDAAIAHGRLLPEDMDALRKDLAADPEGMRETYRLIAVATNAGKLRPERPGDVFP